MFGMITPMNLAIVETMRDIRFFLINFLFFYAINDVHLFNASFMHGLSDATFLMEAWEGAIAH